MNFKFSSSSGLKKKLETQKKLQESLSKRKCLEEDAEEDSEKSLNQISISYLKEVSSELKLSEKSKDSEEFVIPLIEKNQWRQSQKNTASSETKPNHEAEKKEKTLDEIAAEEILKETNSAAETSCAREEDISIPILLRNRVPGFSEAKNEEERFKLDLQMRPDETSLNYANIPVTKFGVAMLRGMGWKEGEPIGFTNKQIVKPLELNQKYNRRGLGATPKDMSEIISGQKKNKSGAKDEGEKFGKQEKGGEREEKDAKSERDVETWVLEGLLVKIVNKNYQRGKFYNEKVVVKKVLHQKSGKCVCETHDGIILHDLTHSDLETVIPKNKGPRVVFVAGAWKGTFVALESRDDSKYSAVVRFVDGSMSGKRMDVSFDDICESCKFR